MKNEQSGKYVCTAKYHPLKEEWLDHENSPKDYYPTFFKVQWPKVGSNYRKDGGLSRRAGLELTSDELYQRMIAWNEHNMLLGAATEGDSAGFSEEANFTNGLVDHHAYSIIDGRANVCDTGVDLLLLRNPWGRGGEIKKGTS